LIGGGEEGRYRGRETKRVYGALAQEERPTVVKGDAEVKGALT